MKVGLSGRSLADPPRRETVVVTDRRRHRPAHGLHELGSQVARDAEKAFPPGGVEDGELAPEHRVAAVREHLVHHVDQGISRRHEQPLLPVGREAHVARSERSPVRARDSFLSQALHVERRLALAMGSKHGGVESPDDRHVPQAKLKLRSPQGARCPGAGRVARVVEHTHEPAPEAVDDLGLRIDSRPEHLARRVHRLPVEADLVARPVRGRGEPES